MEHKVRRKKTITEELDEIIEMKKNEASAWKKIADSLTNHERNNTKKATKE